MTNMLRVSNETVAGILENILASPNETIQINKQGVGINIDLAAAAAKTWKGNATNSTAIVNDNVCAAIAETTSSVLQISNGQYACLAPVSVEVRRADVQTDGYVAAADFASFAAKLDPVSAPQSGDFLTVNALGRPVDSGLSLSTSSSANTNTQILSAAATQTAIQNQITGGLNILGSWDASQNLPLLTAGTGVPGDAYLVSVAGTQSAPSGQSVLYNVSDIVFYTNGSNIWDHVTYGSSVSNYNLAIGTGLVPNTGSGQISPNAGGGLFIDIAGGSGIIAATSGAPLTISWPNMSMIPLQTSGVAYIGIDVGLNVQQQDFPLSQNFLTNNVLLGHVLFDTQQNTIYRCTSAPCLQIATQSQVAGLATYIGLLNLDTPCFFGNSDLTISYNGGRLFGVGLGTSPFEPNLMYISGANPATFTLATSTTIVATNVQTIPLPTMYDQNGTLVPSPYLAYPDSSYNLFVFLTCSGELFIQYGQQVFQTMALALAALTGWQYFSRHPWIGSGNGEGGNALGILIGVLTVPLDATNLAVHAQIAWTNKFGHVVNLNNTFVDIGNYQNISGSKIFVGTSSGYDQPLSLSKEDMTAFSSIGFPFMGLSSDGNRYSYYNQNVQYTNRTHPNEEAATWFNIMHKGANTQFLGMDNGSLQLQGEQVYIGTQPPTIDSTTSALLQPSQIGCNFTFEPSDLYQGMFDPSPGLFPSQSVLQNQTWQASANGNIQGQPISQFQIVTALVDSPGQTLANWAISNAAPPLQDFSAFGTFVLSFNTFQRSLQGSAAPLPGFVLPNVITHTALTGMVMQGNGINIPAVAASMAAGFFLQPSQGTTSIDKHYCYLAMGQIAPTTTTIGQDIAYAISSSFSGGDSALTLYGLKDETNPTRNVQNVVNRILVGDTTATIADTNVGLQVLGGKKAKCAHVQLDGQTQTEIDALAPAFLQNGLVVFNTTIGAAQIYINGVWKTLATL